MTQAIRLIARYTLLEALRNRLAWLFLAVALIGIGLAAFLQEMALTEGRQLQLSVLAAFLRLAAVFLMATFVITSIAREFADKSVELFMAMPIPRAAWFFGKFAGFCGLAVLPAAMYGGLCATLAPPLQALLWSLSLLAELWLLVAFCLLCVLSLSHVMGALSAVLGFYLLARTMSAFQQIANAPLQDEGGTRHLLNMVVDVVALLVPRLDRFTPTEWLVYHTGSWTNLASVLMQAGVFLALLIGAALFDLYRKNI